MSSEDDAEHRDVAAEIDTSDDQPDEWSVKLYELNDCSWNDHGTGFLRCCYLEKFSAPGLYLRNEADEPMLESMIHLDEVYERQGESIIMWQETDGTNSHGYALSFEDTYGCHVIWKAIRDIQHQYHSYYENGLVPIFRPPGDVSQFSDVTMLAENPDLLPEVSKDNISQIKDIITSVSPMHRESYANFILENNGQYFHCLLDYFSTVEAQLTSPLTMEEDSPEHPLSILANITDIVRAILILNDETIISGSIEDPVFGLLCGVFEYDRGLKRRVHYRELLKSSGPLPVVPLPHGLVEESQALFRMKLMKERWIRPALDDTGCATLTQLIIMTSQKIASTILKDIGLLKKILRLITGDYDDRDYANLECEIHESGNDVESVDDGEEYEGLNRIREEKLLGEKIRMRLHAGRFLRELFMLSRYIEPLKSRQELCSEMIRGCSSLWIEVFCLGIPYYELNHERSIEGVCQVNCPSWKIEESLTLLEVFANISQVIPDDCWQFLILSGKVPVPHPDFSLFTYAYQTKGSSGSGNNNNSSTNGNSGNSGAGSSASLGALGPHLVRKVTSSSSLNSSQSLSNVGSASSSVRNKPPGHTCCRYPLSSLRQNRQCVLFIVVEALLCNPQGSAAETASDILKYLIEGPPQAVQAGNGNNNNANAILMRSSGNNKEAVLTLFYDRYLPWITLPFLEPRQPDRYWQLLDEVFDDTVKESTETSSSSSNKLTWKDSSSPASHSTSILVSRRCIMELLTRLVESHAYRMKYFMMRSNTISRINRLFICSNKTLQCYATKFLKSISMSKDEFYFRHIIKNDLLLPYLQLMYHLIRTRADNLVSATVSDLLEVFRVHGARSIVLHCIERYNKFIKSLEGLVKGNGDNSKANSNINDENSKQSNSNIIRRSRKLPRPKWDDAVVVSSTESDGNNNNSSNSDETNVFGNQYLYISNSVDTSLTSSSTSDQCNSNGSPLQDALDRLNMRYEEVVDADRPYEDSGSSSKYFTNMRNVNSLTSGRDDWIGGSGSGSDRNSGSNTSDTLSDAQKRKRTRSTEEIQMNKRFYEMYDEEAYFDDNEDDNDEVRNSSRSVVEDSSTYEKENLKLAKLQKNSLDLIADFYNDLEDSDEENDKRKSTKKSSKSHRASEEYDGEEEADNGNDFDSARNYHSDEENSKENHFSRKKSQHSGSDEESDNNSDSTVENDDLVEEGHKNNSDDDNDNNDSEKVNNDDDKAEFIRSNQNRHKSVLSSLPPLRSRFAVDDDDDDFSLASFQSHRTSNSNNANNSGNNGSGQQKSGGISFQLKKKK